MLETLQNFKARTKRECTAIKKFAESIIVHSEKVLELNCIKLDEATTLEREIEAIMNDKVGGY